ncbi:methyl-accepting chemotaxis protein [Alteromonas ponticola]|uniref:Methyl-accepting chemotaxis protein n=1 Tax=Alteromonas aquimaris TaxID=2998417 RepID=A0ABT3P8N4_9ALTE|nr:PAS domain-containing methyl-accepting chemotaxis protein [Alteromonas aquimaris]MCW8109132.1 methyl-accepting chemotaxis protein [Alteromonas aquimaris]
MFNQHLKAEIQELKDELFSLRQVRDSLEEEMLFVTLNADRTIRSVNREFEIEMNYNERELIGRAILDLVPAIARHTPHYARLEDALKTPIHYAGVFECKRGNDEDAWLRVILQPVMSQNGEVQYFTLHGNDLTRTITTSREYENLVQALQRSTAVIEFDLKGMIETANTPFLDALGYSLKDIQGKHHSILCTTDDARSSAYEQFWQQLRRGEAIRGRFRRIDSRGNTVWLEASYNPVYDQHDVLYKVVQLATVVTNQVEREKTINDAADIAYDTSNNTEAAASRGSAVVAETVQVMNTLAEQMIKASQGINDLDSQSQQIATIIESISSIAEQTNLLALNAAIEAARAGDQGRGFAVVADEVRQLASRTTSATEEIVGVVQRNQSLAAEAVNLVDSGKQQAEKGLQLAKKAGQVIEEIGQGARQVVEAVGQVTNKLEQ